MAKNLTEFEQQYLGLDPEEFVKLAAYSAAQKSVAYFLIFVELFVQLAILLVGLVNLRIIKSTTVIHRNLKFILLAQSCTILYYALIRLALVAPVKYFTGDFFWSENEFRSLPIEYLFDLPLFFRLFLGHVLILERAMATLFAKLYEKHSGKLFSIGWFSTVLLVTLFNLLFKENQKALEDMHNEPKTRLILLVVTLSLAFISLLETILLLFIWYHNKSKLAPHSLIANTTGKRPSWEMEINYDLAKRYQYLENMRTTIQLGPTLIVYFLIQLDTAFSQAFHFFQYIPDDYADEIITQTSNLALAIFNLLILMTTILFHPILRQNLRKMLGQIFFCCNKVNNNAVAPSNVSMRCDTPVDEVDRHFRMLQTAWEQK